MHGSIILNFILLALIIFGGVGLLIFYRRKKQENIDQGIDRLRQDLDQKQREQHQEIKEALEKAQNSYSRLQKELGVVQEIGTHVRDLQKTFQSPKLRGNLGEQVLEELLSQILPQSGFEIQYKFRDGSIVDAVVKTNSGLIPIDSKYSLETFRRLKEASSEQQNKLAGQFKREIKKHIKSISKKYIRPGENTVDFAIMYLPSEAVYYEVIMNYPQLIDYGDQKKVYLCSPNTFNYLLKVVMLGLEQAKVEETAFQILQETKTFQQELNKVGGQLNTLFNHLKNARNILEKVQHTYDNLSLKISKIINLKEDVSSQKNQKSKE